MRGLIPRMAAGLHIGARGLVVVFGLSAIIHWFPPAYVAALPWVLLAAAAAVGWSARDFLPDLFAGVVLLIERRIRPGMWVSSSSFSGKVETLGPRGVRLRDTEGQIVSVPNRKLLSDPIRVDRNKHPRVDVSVRVDPSIHADEARRAIEDAALLSPWRVIQEYPDVRRDSKDVRSWTVRVRLLEPKFHRAFESALIDHVEESLGRSHKQS